MSETGDTVTEVLFYQLERQPLDAVLPGLLERTLERGWRAVVQAGGEERLTALDSTLWTYREDSFLPHGTKRDGFTDQQPVYLTTGEENPNNAELRFMVDGAQCDELSGYRRVVYLFDGRNDEARAQARGHWKSAKASGFDVTYWQQSERGRWEKKA